MILVHIRNRLLRIAIVIIVLFCFFNCTKNETLKEISERDKQALNLIDNYIKTDFKIADAHIDSLINKANINKNALLLAEAYLRKGFVLTIKEEYKNSIDTLKKGVEIIKNYKNLPLKNLFLLRIGNNYVLDEKNYIALQYYLPVYEDAKRKNNVEHLFKSSVNIAKIRRNAGKYEEALEKYKTAYKQTKQIEVSEYNTARVLMGIGGTYLKLQEPDSALYYSRKGFEISKLINDKVGESYFFNDFGIAYFLKEDYNQSLDNLSKAEKYLKAINNNKRLSETLFYKGSCYYKKQEYKEAINYFENVLSIVNKSEKLNNKKFEPLFLENTYDFLSKSYLAIDNINKSIMYETKRDKLSFTTNKENNEIKATLHESDLRIVTEEFIKKMHVADAKRVVYNKWIIIFIVIFCIASLYFILHYKKEAKKNKERFEKLIKSQEIKPEKRPSKVKITDAKVEEILQKLEKVEQQEYYLEVTCSLANMAKKVRTNGTYLTKILKEQKGKTFYEYINELRINYAINRLKTNTQFRKYAIMHIAKEVGYKSPESFTKHFKKATGINPSYYIKELEKLNT
ncbi:tetratricopeptide repeat protein [uncultured Lacinutrix sp.]|uniref:tetratricopeptide repeat protein n=1 Tax=uncultured Lacinutrix sp. TaxID=574032 RepID=UPI002626BEAF|nr:tetratricopeptide repeat protein [uncultured Lacinutrix sp.]